jgi:hypothetical protein
MKVKRIATASLGDDDLDQLEIKLTKAMTPSERIEVCFELSNFCQEIHDAARRCCAFRQRTVGRNRK